MTDVKTRKQPMSLDEARAELKTVVDQLFSYVWDGMEKGMSYTDAFSAAYKAHPENHQREAQLREWIKSYEDNTKKDARALAASDVRTAGEAEVAVLGLVECKLRANPGMGYGDALKLVASERPQLFRRREALRDRGGYR